MKSTVDLEGVFLEECTFLFKKYRKLAEDALQQIPEEAWHQSLHPEGNSIAVLIQHLAGNMLSRWTNFLEEDGEKNWRNRDAEFESQNLSQADLMAIWDRGWSVLFDALASLSPADLARTVTIRGEEHRVSEAILRQIAHYSYHVGQIVLLCRVCHDGNWQSLSVPKGKSLNFNHGDWLAKSKQTGDKPN
jgi:uncharacterized damage-inducible protein DinB